MSMPVADAIATIVAACMLRWQLETSESVKKFIL